MSLELTETLVVGISATALFDLSEADHLFREKYRRNPDEALHVYRQHMLEKENEPLNDGTGMPLVRALLNLNRHLNPGEAPIVEVVIISRNSPETGFRVLNEIRRRALPITRSAFLAGGKSAAYLEAFYVDLFLTTNEEDAQAVIDSGVCASALVKSPPKNGTLFDEDQVRFAFDGDAVLFNEMSEVINQKEGLEKFWSYEDALQDVPLLEGPYANLLKKLSKIKARFFHQLAHSPIKLAIITARNSPAEMRVIKTLRSWDVYIDQAFFLGGLEKRRFLKAFQPHIFFDDQDSHLDKAASDVPSAKVLYPSHSPLKRVMAQARQSEGSKKRTKGSDPAKK